jgi:hypothetical protein
MALEIGHSVLTFFRSCCSANFPLITITLRENLRTLAHNINSTADHERAVAHDADATGVRAFVVRNLYALVALVPPLLVAFSTEDVSMLVGYTGAYAGLGIQVCRIDGIRQCRSIDQQMFVRSGSSLRRSSSASGAAWRPSAR